MWNYWLFSLFFKTMTITKKKEKKTQKMGTYSAESAFDNHHLDEFHYLVAVYLLTPMTSFFCLLFFNKMYLKPKRLKNPTLDHLSIDLFILSHQKRKSQTKKWLKNNLIKITGNFFFPKLFKRFSHTKFNGTKLKILKFNFSL